ncbi:hypothetical protein Pmani_003180 [Petrolisthes manimaculis]|uniref:Ionotropic glutamate receptor C-terminal domain-containing protein n=1 Tax=Petrolisthes manimaculis TaxID=1843537 RepID=A0AAE1UMS0_9EUCA|nr:hypothetical protein Pmani_003180 [Petrolisthes manimaculis]
MWAGTGRRVHWVVVVLEDGPSITASSSHLPLSLRITWLIWSPRLSQWVVMVGIASEDGMKVKEAAKWLKGDESTVISGAKLPLRTPYLNNFFGSVLRVASRRTTDPRHVFHPITRCYFNPTGVTECTGYVGQLLMLVIGSLNLTIVNSKYLRCGLANQEGTRVMAVQERKADIALGTCSITSNRLQAVDFTEFFKVIRSSILTGEPAAIDSAFVLFDVLSGSTWLCLVGYLVMVTTVLWMMGRILATVYPGLYLPLKDSIAVTTKSFIYQPHGRQPISVSGRGVVAVSWVAVITIASVYSGNLTAWLCLPRYERPVDSLEDLVDRPYIIPVVVMNDPNHMMFVNRTEGLLGNIAPRLAFRDEKRFQDHNLMKRVWEGTAAYFNSDRSHINRAASLNDALGRGSRFTPCGIHLGIHDLRQDYLGLMINKNSWFNP